MKLEYGKRYVRRNGEVTGPLVDNVDTEFPYTDPNDETDSWRPDGDWGLLSGGQSEWDLVSEYVEPCPVTADGDLPIVTSPLGSNPKTAMGRLKTPMLSVIPPASLIHQADAMNYGAFLAPKKDGTKGYGPYNWRDQPIEAGVYVDAAMRHLLQWWDGEDNAQDSGAHHLGHALATIGILLDAIENKTAIDDRPKVKTRAASRMFAELKDRAKS